MQMKLMEEKKVEDEEWIYFFYSTKYRNIGMENK